MLLSCNWIISVNRANVILFKTEKGVGQNVLLSGGGGEEVSSFSTVVEILPNICY